MLNRQCMFDQTTTKPDACMLLAAYCPAWQRCCIGSIILFSRRPSLAAKTYRTKLLQGSSIHETFT